MADNSQIPSRSISLPSRFDAVKPPYFEQKLKMLTSWHISTFPKEKNSISSLDIQSVLEELAKLYHLAEELIQESPSTQQSTEESLDESVELLDSCNTIKDLLQMMKESIQALQSALRRKGLGSGVQKEINSYFNFRKNMTKSIVNSLKTLKNLENKKKTPNNSGNADSKYMSALRELTGVSVPILKNILMFLSSPMDKPKGWSLVSKLVLTKSSGEDKMVNEVESVDFAISCIQMKNGNNSSEVSELKMLQMILQRFVERMEGVDERLDRLFRELVRSRVTLLNILAHF